MVQLVTAKLTFSPQNDQRLMQWLDFESTEATIKIDSDQKQTHTTLVAKT